jgi:predicted MPP superfamily phosphohydrolase
MDEHDLMRLRERMGDHYLGRRLRAQVTRILFIVGQGRGGFHYENVEFIMRVLRGGLHLTGLDRRGRANALALQVRENTVVIPNLPPAFDGLRIAHLSDLHLDGYAGLGRHIAATLADHPFDLAVLTGDYRFHTTGQDAFATRELHELVPALRQQARRFGVLAILGNHDFIEMVPELESAGARTLLNEAHALQDGNVTLWIVGLDDAHYYGVHDFEMALRDIPASDPRILLIHSPEVIPEASARGFALYLTGHTHGGQVCLPGGIPVLVNAKCARRYIAGVWQHNGMAGYTSRGVGSSGVFARFFCPPEIVIHVLRR